MDLVFLFADHATLILLRQVCRHWRLLADRRLAPLYEHLVLVPLDGARHLVFSGAGECLGTTRGLRDATGHPLRSARSVDIACGGLLHQDVLDVLGGNMAVEIKFVLGPDSDWGYRDAQA